MNSMNDKCFALSARQKCIALSNRGCVGRTICPFYKTRERAEADREKVNARLCALSIEKQAIIADKYYEGRMPWRECI